MIYNYNILGIYETKSNRQYDNSGNPLILHHFETNKIPAIQLVVTGTVTACSYILYDKDEAEVSSGSFTVENATNEAGTAYSRLLFTGVTLTEQEDGLYYLKITYDGTPLYTDVFCWKTDVSGYLKISATTTSMSIGGFTLNQFTYLVYLEAKNFLEEYTIEEEGKEKTYGTEPYFTSRNHSVEYDITGYRNTLNFLSGLRTVSVNGTVTVTWKGESFEIYDIETPENKSSYSNSDIIVIGFKHKVKDYLQTFNEI